MPVTTAPAGTATVPDRGIMTVRGVVSYPVNVRYQRAYRTDVEGIRRTLISTPSGAQIPIGEVADIRPTMGPMVLRTEQAQLLGYVYVDVGDRDIGGYVEDAKAAVEKSLRGRVVR